MIAVHVRKLEVQASTPPTPIIIFDVTMADDSDEHGRFNIRFGLGRVKKTRYSNRACRTHTNYSFLILDEHGGTLGAFPFSSARSFVEAMLNAHMYQAQTNYSFPTTEYPDGSVAMVIPNPMKHEQITNLDEHTEFQLKQMLNIAVDKP